MFIVLLLDAIFLCHHLAICFYFWTYTMSFVISYPFLTHQVCIYHCLSFLPPLCYSPFQNFKIVRLDNIQSLMGHLCHFLHSKAQESLWEKAQRECKNYRQWMARTSVFWTQQNNCTYELTWNMTTCTRPRKFKAD